jgi:uncharacterized protein (DUF2147 family)
MKPHILLATLAIAILPPLAGAADLSSPVGQWRTIDDKTGRENGLVEIWRVGDELQGRVVKVIPKPGDNPNPVCDKCDGPEKGQPVVGMTILKGFKHDGDAWDGGTILDPKSGNVYSSELRLDDGGQKLLVRGYLGISLLGRTQTWLRAD